MREIYIIPSILRRSPIFAKVAAQSDDTNVVANHTKEGSSSTLDVEVQLDTPKVPVRTVHGLKVIAPKTMLMIVAACHRHD